jgi:hypothetical protein
MISRDTCVVSKAMVPKTVPAARALLGAQAAKTHYLPSLTIAELSALAAAGRTHRR